MKYLIKSLKWTKNDKVETWYKPDSNGYTTLIANAGIYTEEDKNNMDCLISEKVIAFIPLTQKVINKSKRQLKKKVNELEKYLIEINERFKRNIAEVEKDIDRIKENEVRLSKLQELIVAEGEGENE